MDGEDDTDEDDRNSPCCSLGLLLLVPNLTQTSDQMKNLKKNPIRSSSHLIVVKKLTCCDSKSVLFALDKFSVDCNLHVKGSLCLILNEDYYYSNDY